MSEAAANPAIARQWWVKVRGEPFGPYTMAQMTEFAAKGRIQGATLVSDQKDGAWVEARRVMGLMAPLRPGGDAAQAANVFVHAEIFSGAWTKFMAALEGMGVICALGDGLWLLRTRRSASVIRNTLSQTLGHGDRFIVIDATRDRFAWFNLGPEVDVRISHVWNAPLRSDAHA